MMNYRGSTAKGDKWVVDHSVLMNRDRAYLELEDDLGNGVVISLDKVELDAIIRDLQAALINMKG